MAKSRKKAQSRGNKYAHMNLPQAELDYHDRGQMTEHEIKSIAKDFVEECSERGMKKILIITGKGLHSAQGPVIRPMIRAYLKKLPQVVSVETARRDRGGDGALEVELQ
jgi:DNA-nicking Smr family endonuclease